MIALMVNGELIADVEHAIGAQDRGLQYGDGLFETMRVVKGQVRYWDDHCARLLVGCERLGIVAPDMQMLATEVATLTRLASDAVLKLMVTRGVGGRGYRAAADATPTRILSLHPLPGRDAAEGIVVRWCETRLARNAQLAGLKHLNRLEQVLAQNEWRGEKIAEGLMLDTEGEAICATAANLFVASEGALATPDLRFSGVRGVMRGRVLAAAHALGMEVEERSVWPDELLAASEVFVTNAVRGIRPVIALGVAPEEKRWTIGPVARRLAQTLQLW